MWRGSSGKAYVADAYCPHLGAHLGVCGTVQGENVECPYHGWEFSGKNGMCVKIPYDDNSKKISIYSKKMETYMTNFLKN